MASTLLSKTWSTVGSTTKGTLSMWAKLDNNNGGDRYLYTVLLDNSNELKFMHRDNGSGEGNLRIFVSGTGGASIDLETSRFVRDPSAWYHFVMAIDMAQNTDTNRIKFYINGVQDTFSSAVWSNDRSGGWVAGNTAWSSHIGGSANQSSNRFGGSMAMVEFVDGQQLDPTYFGSTNTATGIWTPADATAISDYGTNGYKLAMDTTSPGADTSGKGNTFSVANGTPTLTQGNPQNNWCTMNPLNQPQSAYVLSQGNNTLTMGGGTEKKAGSATIGVATGKFYWEVKLLSQSAETFTTIGISGATDLESGTAGSQSTDYLYRGQNGTLKNNGGATSYGATWGVGDIVGVALDCTSAQNTLTFYKNGASQGAINITSAASTPNSVYLPTAGKEASAVPVLNFNFGEGFFGTVAAGTNADGNGQGLFAYAVPSGYYALNTKNLEAYG